MRNGGVLPRRSGKQREGGVTARVLTNVPILSTRRNTRQEALFVATLD
jgi:hypothetical protein